MKINMKAKKLILSAMAAAMAIGMGNQAVAATNEVSVMLQKGLFEEEANHNLDAAIKAYQSVIAQTEKDRQFAATAIFRLGECYRKQGNTNDANVQYRRILREFSDQTELAKLSRQQLGPGADLAMGGTGGKDLAEELRKMSVEKRRVAVQQKFPNPVLNSLMEKMVTTEQELVSLKGSYGDQHPEVVSKTAVLKSIYQQIDQQVDGVIDGLEAGALGLPDTAKGVNPSQPVQLSAEELTKATQASIEANEIKRIQVMIRDNPDLINAYNGENTPLLAAIRARQFAVAKFLLENKADPEAKQTGNNDHITPLIWATMEENKDIVDLLLERGANVDATDGNRKTALHHAAERGFKTIVETLLAHKATVDVRTKYGWTPLRFAADKGFKSVAELLVAQGANVNARDDNGYSPLHAAVYSGNKAIVEWLLTAKADINAAATDGTTPLISAVKSGRLEIAKILLARGANVEAQSGNDHLRALHFAVLGNWPECVKLVLENHADVNATCSGIENRGPSAWQNTSMTALMIAANTKFDDVARVLIDHNADVNLKGSSGRTALMIAIEQDDETLIKLLLDHHADPNFADTSAETSLLLAVEKNQLKSVEALISGGANVNYIRPASGNTPTTTPLLLSISQNEGEIVKLLLENGANANEVIDAPMHAGYTATHGLTPLIAAVGLNNPLAVKVLLQRQAEPSRGDTEGRTPLHWAVSISVGQGNTAFGKENVTILLAAGAEVNARDKNGKTPLHLAAEANSTDMVDFLVAHGADVNAKDNNGKTPLDLIGQGGTAGQPGFYPVVNFGPVPGGPRPLTYQRRNDNGNPPSSGGPKDVASILREHGGVSEIELSTIRVMRKGDANVRVIARRDPNSANHCTLFELLANVYVMPTNFRRPPGAYLELIGNSEPPGFRFPDFANLKIHRLGTNGPKRAGANVNAAPDDRGEVTKIDLDAAFAAGDCSKDLELQWGDIVEIPEADHKIEAQWRGLSKEAATTLVKCLQRNVEIRVKEQTIRVTLVPEPPFAGEFKDQFNFPDPNPGAADVRVHSSSHLNFVVRHTNVILASSDLTRVKVRRTDPASGKKTEMTFNLEKTDPETDLWLKDGDVIELPEKSSD
jgi:ankyrin repeat protein